MAYKNKYCAVCNAALTAEETDEIFLCSSKLITEPQISRAITYIVSEHEVQLVPFVKPSCPVGLRLNNSRCAPEHTEWPSCKMLYFTYSILRINGKNSCFTELSSTDISSVSYGNENTTRYDYDLVKYDLPPGSHIADKLNNFTKSLNFTVCSERELELSQLCIVDGELSSNCTDTWYIGPPEQFQPVQINGTEYVIFNGSYITPILWKNTTVYSGNDKFHSFSVRANFNLCGTLENVMDCPSVVIHAFRKISLGNGTGLLFRGLSILPGKFALLPNGSARICWSLDLAETMLYFGSFTTSQRISSHVAMGLSSFCLFATLVTYSVLAPLRNLQGLCIINLIIALLLGQLLIEYPATYLFPWPTLCLTVGVLAHFFLLASFCWMNILAGNLYRSFSLTHVVQRSRGTVRRHVMRYCLAGWVTPGLFVAVCFFVHLWGRDALSLRYGGRGCWIQPFKANAIVFLGPVAISLALNTVFFILTIREIRAMKSDSDVLNHDKKKEKWEELLTFIKISSLMGFGWIVSFIAVGIQLSFVFYVFIVAVAIQGILIFWSFGLNQRVRRMWVEWARSRRLYHSQHSDTERTSIHVGLKKTSTHSSSV
ncbi:uncharacterized protein [Diadema antillarum]|uniref:uncharacterized protein n=1 Tax=Diadema antillarum TaxID=105358 RepID=UPI003A8A5C8F